MRSDAVEIFTRQPCEIAVEDGIASFRLNSGEMDFRLVMPVSVLVQNMRACEEALARWRVIELDRAAVPIARIRGH